MTLAQRKILTEIYRRLNYFKKGDLADPLLLLELPSKAKPAVELGFIKPYSTEIKRVYNWYSLTEAGKEFFANYIEPISEYENHLMAQGRFCKF